VKEPFAHEEVEAAHDPETALKVGLHPAAYLKEAAAAALRGDIIPLPNEVVER
jgi:hypothetical protein